MTSAQKQIHFYVSKKDKSFLYWIQTGFQCLCPSVGHLLVHHNVTCKNACKKKNTLQNTETHRPAVMAMLQGGNKQMI